MENIKHKILESICKSHWEEVFVIFRGSTIFESHEYLHLAVEYGAPSHVIAHLASPHNVNTQDASGRTVLHLVVSEKRWELVPFLIKLGADIDVHNYCNVTPLHLAGFHGAPPDTVAKLISAKNINMQDSDNGDTALHWLLAESQWELISVLLQNGADVNITNKEMETMLHVAVKNGVPIEIIIQLVTKWNINMQEDKGCTALHLALQKNRWELVPVLLQKGADICVLNNTMSTPLHWAVRCYAPKDIIIHNIGPSNINMQDEEGHTALHWAIRMNYWELVPLLLKYLANVNVINQDAKTPLHMAVCIDAPTDIIIQLISPCNINGQDEDGNAPFHEAVRKKRWDLVPVFIETGVDVNVCDGWNESLLHLAVFCDAPTDVFSQMISPHNINMKDEDGNTVLHWAIRDENWELVRILIQCGADVNIANKELKTPVDFASGIIRQWIARRNIKRYRYGNTALLHLIIKYSIWELIPTLLHYGASVNILNNDMQTPLHLALENDAPTNVTLQLMSSKNINQVDKHSSTVLHMAINKERWELVSVLVQNGADINQCGDCNNTALHLAIENNAPFDVVSKLISVRNINMQDEDGCAALHNVMYEKRWELVQLLLKNGSDINLKDSWCCTPLHCALYHNAPSVLTQHGFDNSVTLADVKDPAYVNDTSSMGNFISQLISPQNVNSKDDGGNTPLQLVLIYKRWELVPVVLQYGADFKLCDEFNSIGLGSFAVQPEKTKSLRNICCAIIRSHMHVKTDDAFEGLGLPQMLISYVKLSDMAEVLGIGHQS